MGQADGEDQGPRRKMEVRVRSAPATPAALAAWRKLWARLLGAEFPSEEPGPPDKDKEDIDA